MLGSKKKLMTPQQIAAMEEIQQKMASGKPEEVQEAWGTFFMETQEALKQSFVTANGDKNILAKRGFRQLTSEEKDYYEKLIEAGKSDDPKQAITGIMPAMPFSIIEDVFRDLQEEHGLLKRINFQNVMYLTKWILNDHTKQAAVWGPINSKITEEISSAFVTYDMELCKLAAFAVIEKDMLDLGPTFLDAYIRAFLKEAILCALEKGIVTGDGKNMPIGLDRNISETAAVVSGVYPKKEKIEVTSFAPTEYGELVAKLAKSEKGRMRKFKSVLLICNMTDYLKKIMPATTVLIAQGTFANNLFPFPTEVEISNELNEGDAILCLPEEYFMGIGTSKEGTLEYSDDFKFLDDQRVFKVKMHGNGRAFDNTVSILLDISKLNPAYITVESKVAGSVTVDGKLQTEEVVEMA